MTIKITACHDTFQREITSLSGRGGGCGSMQSHVALVQAYKNGRG